MCIVPAFGCSFGPVYLIGCFLYTHMDTKHPHAKLDYSSTSGTITVEPREFVDLLLSDLHVNC